jgi:hypothetical protein
MTDMTTILQQLREAIRVQHIEAQTNLAHSVTSSQLARAEELAKSLEDKGIPAEVGGAVEGTVIRFWVTARPRTFDAVEPALARLNMTELGRYINDQHYEIHFKGMDAPLFVIVPQVEATQ